MNEKYCETKTINIKKITSFYMFCYSGSAFFIPYGIYNLLTGKILEGAYELTFGIFCFWAGYKIKNEPKTVWLINLILILLLPFFFLMLKFGGIANIGFIWLYVYPVITLFVKGKKGSVLFLLVFYLFYVVLMMLNHAQILTLFFSNNVLLINLSSLLVITVFVYIYEDTIEKNAYDSCVANMKLKDAKDDLTLQIKSRKKAESEMEKILHKLEEKNKFSEDTKKAMINLLEDVSEEKKISSQRADDLQKFKLAVENASDQIIITDADTKIIYANRAAEQITGFSKEELMGQTPALWGRQMDKKYYQNMYRTIKKYKTVFTDEFTNLRKNGQKYIANVYIAPILDGDGKVKYFVGIERDITREKQVDKAKTEFVSLASHQLRTPLSAINWYTEMLLNGDAGKVSKEQKSYLHEIFSGSKKMSDLVNALLNVSRIELGTFVINPKNVDVLDIINDVVKEMTPMIEKKKITVIKKFSAKKLMLKVDPSLTRIIFQNIISNAVKYNNDKGRVEIDVSKQKKYLNIKISDTGYGIPKNQQDKIFSKLFRAENVKQKDTEGTGLGLYIVKAILKQAGGMVWFKSAENKGTTFYIALPVSGMKKKTGTKQLNN